MLKQPFVVNVSGVLLITFFQSGCTKDQLAIAL